MTALNLPPGSVETGGPILAVVQRVCVAVGLPQPSSVFGGSDRLADEMTRVANSAAIRIVQAHDWDRATLEHVLVGDGSSTAFASPPDFDRLPRDARAWSSLGTTLLHVASADDWLKAQGLAVFPGLIRWTTGGGLNFAPAPAAGEVVRFPFMAAIVGYDVSDAPIARFTADDDRFLLDDTLLELGMIAEYRTQKGLPAEAAIAAFTAQLRARMQADSGERVTESKADR